jgi:hypothetical protein
MALGHPGALGRTRSAPPRTEPSEAFVRWGAPIVRGRPRVSTDILSTTRLLDIS